MSESYTKEYSEPSSVFFLLWIGDYNGILNDSTPFDIHKLSAIIFYDTNTRSFISGYNASGALLLLYPLTKRLTINDDLSFI